MTYKECPVLIENYLHSFHRNFGTGELQGIYTSMKGYDFNIDIVQ
jgi:hypothetical protein